MGKVREEFEEWAMSDMGYMCVRVGGGYKDDYMNTAWLAWKASRVALYVELPCSLSYPNNDMVYLSDVEERLEKAGVSYK